MKIPAAPPTPRGPLGILGILGRLWRIVAITLIVLVLLLAGAWFALRHAYPPERLAAMISEQVSSATGRAFRIEGELSIRLLPELAIEANDVVFANADWASQPDMARVRRASFEVSLRDLIDGRIRVLEVDIAGADIHLEADGTGRFNWQLAPREATGGSGGAQPRSIALDSFTISGSRLSYRRPGNERELTLAIVTLAYTGSGERRKLDAVLEAEARRWTLAGETGPLNDLLAGAQDWPVDLRLNAEGARLSLNGTIGTGPRAGSLQMKTEGRIEQAAVLAPFAAGAEKLPMPIEWRTTLHRGPEALRLDPLELTLAGQALAGRATVYTPAKSPQHVEAELSAKSIDLARWRVGAPTARPAPAQKARAPFFGDAPLPLDPLPGLPFKAALQIERLALPDAPPLTGVNLVAVSDPQRLLVEPLAFDIVGGQVRGRLHIAQRPNAEPRTELRLNARQLDMQAVDAAWGGGGHYKGGRANLDLSLAMTGRTPRSLAASANGEVLLTARNVSLAGMSSTLDRDVITRVLGVLMPKQSAGDNLLVTCALVRLPLRGGVARIDRSIAMETEQIAVSASGEINLAKQTLSLAFRPTVKKGLDLNPGSLVQLMLLSGPLENPSFSIDPAGTVRQAANIGVAVATGGISLLFPSLRQASGEVTDCVRGTTAAPAQKAPRK